MVNRSPDVPQLHRCGQWVSALSMVRGARLDWRTGNLKTLENVVRSAHATEY
jgi:hypothetical protein